MRPAARRGCPGAACMRFAEIRCANVSRAIPMHVLQELAGHSDIEGVRRALDTAHQDPKP
jgi:hypothetical protein